MEYYHFAIPTELMVLVLSVTSARIKREAPDIVYLLMKEEYYRWAKGIKPEPKF